MGDPRLPPPSSTAFPSPPRINVAAAEYVRQTATLLGLNGLIQPGSVNVPSGGTMLTAPDTTVGGAGAANRYPWLFTSISTDNLTGNWDDDERLVRRGDVLA